MQFWKLFLIATVLVLMVKDPVRSKCVIDESHIVCEGSFLDHEITAPQIQSVQLVGTGACFDMALVPRNIRMWDYSQDAKACSCAIPSSENCVTFIGCSHLICKQVGISTSTASPQTDSALISSTPTSNGDASVEQNLVALVGSSSFLGGVATGLLIALIVWRTSLKCRSAKRRRGLGSRNPASDLFEISSFSNSQQLDTTYDLEGNRRSKYAA